MSIGITQGVNIERDHTAIPCFNPLVVPKTCKWHEINILYYITLYYILYYIILYYIILYYIILYYIILYYIILHSTQIWAENNKTTISIQIYLFEKCAYFKINLTYFVHKEHFMFIDRNTEAISVFPSDRNTWLSFQVILQINEVLVGCCHVSTYTDATWLQGCCHVSLPT